ncbi:reverse transcriptase domain-containing protein [Tanacetum coccineum]
MEKFFQIFQDLHFDISFTDALILMPKFASTIKSLLSNKEKLFELERTPLNENCSAVLLKKLPEKLGDPGKFLIPCDFPRMNVCLALADLGASINLMPLSVWKNLSLPELSPTCMTLELVYRSISRPIDVAEDVFIKTGRALIDVYTGELTIRVGNKAVTLNLDQTSRYSSNYDDNSVNRIDVIDIACEEYSQEVLGFFVIFLLEESRRSFLSLFEDDPTSPIKLITLYLTQEGGPFFFLKHLLNDEYPSLPPPTQGMYLPEIRKELKIYEAKNDKSSIDEPPEVELKDLPPHLDASPRLDKMLKRCEDTNLCLNWEKSHFMVKEGIVLGHKISKNGIEVDKSKIDVIAKLPHPTTVKGVRSFLGHVAFERLKKKLTEAPILIAPDWDLPFKLMCDASDFAIGAVLGQRHERHFKPIDTKGAENLMADHLSRLENPYENVLDPKEINETFPLETLNMVTFRGDSSTLWFADFANYHARNFIVKGMSSQQKNKFFKDVKHYF